MQGTLVLAILIVKSSYLREVEEPLADDDDIPDTVQWWIAAEGACRIKTFALDHDIHVHSVGEGNAKLVEVAQANNAKHYGDVIAVQHVLVFKNCEDTTEVQKVFKKTGLPPRLEVASGRFAFWKPDDAKYKTQSEPRQ